MVLDITNPVHVDTYGTYITIPEVSAAAAKVNVVTTVKNDGAKAANATVSQRILDASGRQVGKTVSSSANVAAGAKGDIKSFSTLFMRVLIVYNLFIFMLPLFSLDKTLRYGI